MDFFETLLTGGAGAAIFYLLERILSAGGTHLLDLRKSRFETMLARVDALRSEAYGDVWTLTGAFNLFGPEVKPDLAELQTKFRNWYFDRGQFLTPEAKDWYFCAMEVLGAIEDSGKTPQRPSARTLYGQTEDTLGVLRQELARLRDGLAAPQHPHLPERPGAPGKANYQGRDDQPKVALLVAELKAALRGTDSSAQVSQFAWMVAQEVLSRFRSALTGDINGRSRFPLLATS